MQKTISMLSWSRITEGETLDSADFDFLLS
jgi:hypothetical protein